MSKAAHPEIRVIKKGKKGHGGHHGGSWKVAYADFVTAMMAFFLVMWIVGLSQPVKEAIAGYFKDPTGFMKAVDGGKKPFGEQALSGKGAPAVNPELKIPEEEKEQAAERKKFEEAKTAVERIVSRCPEFKDLKDSIQVKVAEDGMRIDLVESSSDLFFDSGSAQTKPRTRALLASIAKEIGKLSNHVIMEGHTDNRPYNGPNGWTNWELSAARANAARAIMADSGLQARQIIEVRGLADTMPLDPVHRDSFKNRRVSIMLPFKTAEKRMKLGGLALKSLVNINK